MNMSVVIRKENKTIIRVQEDAAMCKYGAH